MIAPLQTAGVEICPVLSGSDWAVVLAAGRVRTLRTTEGFEIAHVPGAYRPGLLLRGDRVLLQWWYEGWGGQPTLRWSDDLGWRVRSTPAATPGEASARRLHDLPPDRPAESTHLRLTVAALAQAIDAALAATPHPARQGA